MHITEVCLGDIELLRQKARCEKDAQQRDRYRAVTMAIEGVLTGAIMEKLERSKNFVHAGAMRIATAVLKESQSNRVPVAL